MCVFNIMILALWQSNVWINVTIAVCNGQLNLVCAQVITTSIHCFCCACCLHTRKFSFPYKAWPWTITMLRREAEAMESQINHCNCSTGSDMLLLLANIFHVSWHFTGTFPLTFLFSHLNVVFLKDILLFWRNKKAIITCSYD